MEVMWILVFMVLNILKNMFQGVFNAHQTEPQKCGLEIAYAGPDASVIGICKLLDTLITMLAARIDVSEENLAGVLSLLACTFACIFNGDYHNYVLRLLRMCDGISVEIRNAFHVLLRQRTISLVHTGQTWIADGWQDKIGTIAQYDTQDSDNVHSLQDDDPGMVDLSRAPRLRISLRELGHQPCVQRNDGDSDDTRDQVDAPIRSLQDEHADSVVDLACTLNNTKHRCQLRNAEETSTDELSDVKSEESADVVTETLVALPDTNLHHIANEPSADVRLDPQPVCEQQNKNEASISSDMVDHGQVCTGDVPSVNMPACLAKVKNTGNRSEVEPDPPDENDTEQKMETKEPTANKPTEEIGANTEPCAASQTPVKARTVKISPTAAKETDGDCAASAVNWVPEQPPTDADTTDSDLPKPGQKRQARLDQGGVNDVSELNVALNDDDNVE